MLEKGQKIALNRRTLKDLDRYLSPEEIYFRLMNNEGWPYKERHRDKYLRRDRALVALQYLIAARISEVLRLIKSQFELKSDRVLIKGIKLSKCREDKPRKHEFRDEAFLPLTGRRAPLTKLVLEQLNHVEDGKPIFFITSNSRAWAIVNALLGIPDHWLRAYGEDFLYDLWDHDIMALSDYIKVDARTLQEYLRKGYRKYPVG